MNTPINTHFNVTDQELATANGGNGGIAHVNPEVLNPLKSAVETISKRIQHAVNNIKTPLDLPPFPSLLANR